jgi:hypothetical protein
MIRNFQSVVGTHGVPYIFKMSAIENIINGAVRAFDLWVVGKMGEPF